MILQIGTLLKKIHQPRVFGVFCHGTTDLFLDQIKSHGLKSRLCTKTGVCRPSIWSHPKLVEYGLKSRRDRVYLAVEKNLETCQFSAGHTSHHLGGRAIILETRFTMKDTKKLVIDEDAIDRQLKDFKGIEKVGKWLLRPMCYIPCSKAVQKKDDANYLIREAKFVDEPSWGKNLRFKSFLTEEGTKTIIKAIKDGTISNNDDCKRLCYDAPEWWKSAFTRGTVGYKGVIPLRKLRIYNLRTV